MSKVPGGAAVVPVPVPDLLSGHGCGNDDKCGCPSLKDCGITKCASFGTLNYNTAQSNVSGSAR